MTDDRMLQAWREAQARYFTRQSPNDISSEFRMGWHARDLEMADWSAKVAGLEAELAFWKEKANER